MCFRLYCRFRCLKSLPTQTLAEHRKTRRNMTAAATCTSSTWWLWHKQADFIRNTGSCNKFKWVHLWTQRAYFSFPASLEANLVYQRATLNAIEASSKTASCWELRGEKGQMDKQFYHLCILTLNINPTLTITSTWLTLTLKPSKDQQQLSLLHSYCAMLEAINNPNTFETNLIFPLNTFLKLFL